MVCFDFFGMRLAVDFTAPALLALLTLILPPDAVMQTAAACLLHECAHLLIIAVLGQRPAMLRLSAAGLRLETAGSAVMPLRYFAAIVAAGPLANLAAAVIFSRCGMQAAGAANLSLCLFNLLPYRSTDGGTLLLAAAEHFLLTRSPHFPRTMMRISALLTTVLLFGGMLFQHIRNGSLCGMILFMLLSELTDDG